MNDQVYQDIKTALSKMADKVPQTWELLVTENARRAMWNIIVGVSLCAIGYCLIFACYRAAKSADAKGDKQEAEAFCDIALFGFVIVTVLFIGCVFSNLDTVVAPNVMTMKELIGK